MANRAFRLLLANSMIKGKRRKFHVTSNQYLTHENPRSGYPAIYDNKPEIPKSLIGKFGFGLRLLGEEIKLYWSERVEAFHVDPVKVLNEGEVDPIWKFDGTTKSRNEWVVTCDSDYNLGYSVAKLELSPHGTGIFHGYLNHDPPKDGKTKYAGFCNITTTRKMKSFAREIALDWTSFTHLVLRVRGDGRAYMVNILQKGDFDLTWNNMYHYPMYTTGGPYWQTIRIPFSKFFFGYKGAVQDKQVPIDLGHITNIGLTLSDKVPGPFKLEIDYIGIAWSGYHFEDFAYEMYNMDTAKE